MKIILPRANANASEKAGPEYYDYVSHTLMPGNIENYRITRNMGRGKYSDVFEGGCVEDGRRIVIKVLKPVNKAKVNREVSVLKSLKCKSIIPMRDLVYDKQTATYSIIFNYVDHKETTEFFEGMGLAGIRHYMRQLLEALEHAHSRGIMHRDVKPQNIVINASKKRLVLIDWGLAEFYLPEKEYSVHVSSRYYKGPELLVQYPFYDYSLDIWSFGCVMAELVFGRKAPLFRGPNNEEQIIEISKLLGTSDLEAYLEKYEIDFKPQWTERTGRGVIETYVGAEEKEGLVEVVDLLNQILVYDHSERPTAGECLAHSFFDKENN